MTTIEEVLGRASVWRGQETTVSELSGGLTNTNYLVDAEGDRYVVRIPGAMTFRGPEDGPRVILCTAHAEHAVDAFEYGAVDYVLKPVEAARLQKALDRLLRDLRIEVT